MKRDLHKAFNIQENDGLQVPEDYFTSLEGEVMRKIKPFKKPKVKSRWPQLAAVAASLAILIAFLNLFYNQQGLDSTEGNEYEIAQVSLEDYSVEEYYDELSTFHVDIADYIIIEN